MFMYICAAIVGGLILILGSKFGFGERKKGVYKQPNIWYPLKYGSFFLLLQLRRWKDSRQKKGTGSDAGYGMRSRNSFSEMEKPQSLNPDYPLAIDAVYFNGGNSAGCYMVAATARRHNYKVNTILLLRIPCVGLFQMPNMPDTNLIGGDPVPFSAGGLRIEPVLPMAKWRLTFKGKLWHVEEEKEVDASFDLDWTAVSPIFDFDVDMDTGAMCDAFARETWSRAMFDRLKQLHQTHYEQFGEITGDFIIENKEPIAIKIQGVRDHSYGNVRDWKDLHRYILQYMYLDDGTTMCVGAISMPQTLSQIKIGYVFHPDGRKDIVTSSELELYSLAEDGNMPKDFSISFAAGGTLYDAKAHEEACPVFYMGEDWEARINERLCTYNVNGVRGWGISEWKYNNVLGKTGEMERLSKLKL